MKKKFYFLSLFLLINSFFSPYLLKGNTVGYGNAENIELIKKAENYRNDNTFIERAFVLRETIRLQNERDIQFLLKEVQSCKISIEDVILRLKNEKEFLERFHATLKESSGISVRDKTILETIIAKLYRNGEQFALIQSALQLLSIYGNALASGCLPFTPVANQITIVKYTLLAMYLEGKGYENMGKALINEPNLISYLQLVYPAEIPEIVNNEMIKASLLYDNNKGCPRFWMPNAGYIFRGNPVVQKDPVSITSDIFQKENQNEFQIRGLDCVSSISLIYQTPTRLSTRGFYLANREKEKRLTHHEENLFRIWKETEQSKLLDIFDLIDKDSLQAGDIVNWRHPNKEEGHMAIFLEWLDRDSKTPIFLAMDFNRYDAFLEGPGVTLFELKEGPLETCFVRYKH